MIKYCPQCPDMPYTTDDRMTTCPVCGSRLKLDMLKDTSKLDGRPLLRPAAEETCVQQSGDGTAPESVGNCGKGETVLPRQFGGASEEPIVPEEDAISEGEKMSSGILEGDGETDESASSWKTAADGSRLILAGKMIEYHSMGDTERFLPQKLRDAVVYRQRFDDTLHTFRLVDSSGNSSAIVNFYGILNGAGVPENNTKVRVSGKFNKDHVFMADRVCVVTQTADIPIRLKYDIRLIKACCIAATVLLLVGMIVISGIVNAGSLSGFTDMVVGFLSTWLAVYIGLFVLYGVTFFTKIGILRLLMPRGKSKSSMPLAFLIVSFVITLILYNGFGLKNFIVPLLSQGIYWGVSIALMLWGIGWLLKCLR